MRHLLLRSLLVLVVLVVSLGFYRVTTSDYVSREASDHVSLASQVLGVADSIENMFFKVAIPATFEDTVTFNKPIIAPDLITSLAAGDGITITAGEIPRITNTGVLELVAGTGISVDGNKITSTITQGITSLSAGTNISIDGNKITNTYTAPDVDYTLGGWTDNGTSVTLTTTTDSVTVGTLTTGAITATSLTTSGLALAGGLTVTSGNSLLPDTDLGSDIGSASKRFNNLWVANINSNSSQSFSGQSTFSYSPTDATLTQASVIINPTTSFADGQLLGLGIGGYQRALIDEDGDIVLGYNSLTSAPATDYPLNIYGHSGTRVSFTDTSGNGYFAGNVGIGTTSPGANLHISSASTSAYSPYLLLDNTAVSGGGSTMLHLKNKTGNAGMQIFSSSGGGNYIQSMDYNGDGTSPTLGLTGHGGSQGSQLLLKFANTAIGTGTATAKLHVFGGADTQQLIIKSNATQTANLTEWQNSSGTALSYISPTGGAYFAGNVGIGTTAPGYLLEVNGGFQADTLYSIGSIESNINLVGADRSILNTGRNMTISANNILMSGNVGIGTTSPSYKLHVSGDGQQILMVQNINAVNPSYVRLLTNTTSANTTYAVGSFGGTAGTPFITGVDASLGYTISHNSNNYLTIISGGNVGIGTTSPTSKLHVSGAVTGKALAIFDETGDQNILVASASGTNRFVITNAGNVGIGTTAPGYKLEVNGSLSALYGNVLGVIGGTLNQMATITGDSGVGSIGFYKNGSSLEFKSYDNGANAVSNVIQFTSGSVASTAYTHGLQADPTLFIHSNTTAGTATNQWLSFTHNKTNGVITTGTGSLVLSPNSGFVGIGTTAPAYALDVKATGTGVIARFASDNSTLCTLATDGTLSCTSDRSLKKNIDTISYGLSDVMKLNPVAFNWNFSSDQEVKSLGFIAQDVETVIPGLVTIDGNGLRSLNTIGLVPVLARAIQEQQLEIDEIKLSTGSASITQGEWNILSELVAMIKSTLESLQAQVTGFTELFITKKSIQEELCIGTKDENTCLSQDQIKTIINNLSTFTPSEATESGEVGPSPTPDLSPTPTATPSAAI